MPREREGKLGRHRRLVVAIQPQKRHRAVAKRLGVGALRERIKGGVEGMAELAGGK